MIPHRVLIFIACFTLALAGRAYDFIASPPIIWPDGGIRMELQLDTTMSPRVLQDGKTSWNAVAEEAMAVWNAQLSRVHFAGATGTARGDGNGQNEVFFSPTVYGQRFGNRVLAVTTTWRKGTRHLESDTIFNTAIDWDSYRGAVDYDVIDLRRVLIHEFGHVLGLDHPNAVGQVEVAIMNSIISDLDTLANDDIRGIRALYPPDARFSLTVDVFPPGSGDVLLTPPPDTDGRFQAGTLVTLVAKPHRRHRFNFWGSDEIRAGRTLRVSVVEDENITAAFSTNGVPVILAQPRSQFASSPGAVVLRVRSASALAPTYQWFFNGDELPAATSFELIVNLAGHENSGLYSCRVANARGEVFSKPARLVVDGY